MLDGSVGSPYVHASKPDLMRSIASAYRARGTSTRVGMAHPCPPCMHATAVDGRAASRLASSRNRLTDLPPSSRNTGLRVAAAALMIALPVAVDPVNATMSTSGDVDSTSPTRWSLLVTMLTTPGGMSVCSAMRRPRRVALHGVSGAGFTTHVLPIASTGPSLLRVISIGKFHGTMTPTTPTGSFHT